MTLLGYRLLRKREIPNLEILFGVFVLLILVWDLVGFPDAIARLTLFDRVTETRSIVPLGVTSILWICILIDGLMRGDLFIDKWLRIILCAATIGGIYVYVVRFNAASDNFLSVYQAVILCLFVAACVYFLVCGKTLIFALLVLLPNVAYHGLVNPVSVGLAPILDNPLYAATKNIVARDPYAKWIVYGDRPLANLVYGAGAKVFNGAKWIPNLDEMKTISADAGDVAIYNRYGSVILGPSNGSGMRFVEGPANDTVVLLADPLDEHWKSLNITYCMSPYPFNPEVMGAMQHAWRVGPVFIYQYIK